VLGCCADGAWQELSGDGALLLLLGCAACGDGELDVSFEMWPYDDGGGAEDSPSRLRYHCSY